LVQISHLSRRLKAAKSFKDVAEFQKKGSVTRGTNRAILLCFLLSINIVACSGVKKNAPIIKKEAKKAADLKEVPKNSEKAVVSAKSPSVSKIKIEGEPFKGEKDAPITIVEYGDFQCPYCRKLKKVLDELVKWHPGKIRFIYKNYPLSFHLYSYEAAEAWYAAREKGKSWEMYDLLYKDPERIERDDLIGYAKKLGLDEKRFLEILEEEIYDKEIEAVIEEGKKNGVTSLPTIFINGKKISGLKDLQTLKEYVAKELGEKVPAKLDEKVMTTVGADINMRLGPGVHFAVVWHINKITSVDTLEVRNEWIKVKYQGFNGWVHKSLLK